MRILFLLSAIALTSCQQQPQQHKIGDYFYGDGTLLHIDRNCGGFHKGLINAHEAYKNLYRDNNDWLIRRSYGWSKIDFCADCISDEHMKQIEDSIATNTL